MFRVTVDIFSGRNNPTWIIDNEEKGRDLLAAIRKERQIITDVDSGFQGLGFRGLTFELFSDEDSTDLELPATFSITNGAGKDHKKGVEIAGRVIEEMTKYKAITLPEHAVTPIDQKLQKHLLEKLHAYELKPPKIFPPPRQSSRGIRVTVVDEECRNCQYEESRFNPAFWNSDPNVRRNNNCYNYARNWRTNTFAQPGRATGCSHSLTCTSVAKAAICDGLRKRCECLSEKEYPRRLVALVVDPGFDYHWYRKQKAGFWGHKPGQTAAKNVDNSGVIITDPKSCDRGGYTDFCGFFYAGKSVRII